MGLADLASLGSFVSRIAAASAMTGDMYEPTFRSYLDRMSGDVTGAGDASVRGLRRWQQ
jgi:hypothetical protein